jgi:hypothetical protein
MVLSDDIKNIAGKVAVSPWYDSEEKETEFTAFHDKWNANLKFRKILDRLADLEISVLQGLASTSELTEYIKLKNLPNVRRWDRQHRLLAEKYVLKKFPDRGI